MTKNILSIIGIYILLASNAYANARMLHTKVNRGSEEIRIPIAGITVLSEDLIFIVNKIFTDGNFEELSPDHSVDVNAIYTVKSINDAFGIIDFITAYPVNAKILVNDKCIKADNAVIFDDATNINRWSEWNASKYRVSFECKLIKGINTISVKYSHRLSIQEHINTFKNIFHNWFDYYLYPLKEWPLDPCFHININVKLKEKVSLWRRMFFGKPTITAIGYKDYKDSMSRSIYVNEYSDLDNGYIIPMDIVNNKNGQVELYNMQFNKDFPSGLRIFIN